MKKENLSDPFRALLYGDEKDKESAAKEISELFVALSNWEKLMGTLCLNIWHSTNDEFEKTKDYLGMEWPFLCGLYIFHNWDNSRLSKRHSIAELIKEVDPSVIIFKDLIINSLPDISNKINDMVATSNLTQKYREFNLRVEPSKFFISIFTEALLSKYGKSINKINPMDFFQFGLEVLLLFTLEVKVKNNDFYNLIEDIGPYEEKDANEVLKLLNTVFEK